MVAQLFILVALFGSPGLAMAGAALAAVPIIIHLLNRRRFRRVIWAAMDWLLAAQRKNARRIRLEQLLLLAIRCAIMILIGLALARPVLKAMNLGGLGQAQVLRVLILDDSYAMNYGQRKTENLADRADANSARGSSPSVTPAKFGADDTSLFRAQSAAIELIKMFDDRDLVMVILAGAPARPLFREPGSEHKSIVEAIQSLKPTARGSDLAGALNMAKAVLTSQKSLADEDVQVVLLADRSQSAWRPAAASGTANAGGHPEAAGNGAGQTPVALDEAVKALRRAAPRIQMSMIDCGQDDAENLAITDLSVRHEVVSTEHQLFVTATIRNFSSAERTGLQLRLSRDPQRDLSAGEKPDEKVKTVAVPAVAAGRAVTVEQQLTLDETGFHTVRAVLLDATGQDPAKDGLLLDNERFLTLRVRRWINVRLADGHPAPLGGKPWDSAVYWLKAALAPVDRAGEDKAAELDSYTLHPDDDTTVRPTTGWLDHQDLLVLANVDLAATAGNKELAAEIAAFVRRGGGLMIFMGSQTKDKENLKAYNDLFYCDGAGPMPAKLVDCVGNDERTDGESFQVRPEDLNHPVLAEADFKSEDEPLKTAQFFRHVKAEVPADRPATVLLRYGGGDPAIVLSKFGGGRVALITSSANNEWNNFPGKTDYLPLFQQLAYYLSPVADSGRNLPVDSPISELLTTEQAKEAALTLVLPGWTAAACEAETFKVTAEPRPGDSGATRSVDRWQYQAASENLGQPGLYMLKVSQVGSQLGPDGKPLPTDRLEQLSRFWYSVNPPAAEEGDVRPVAPDAIKDILGKDVAILKPAEVRTAKADLLGGSDISRTLLYAVLALCLLETVLAQRFGHFRE